MERAKRALELTDEEAKSVAELTVHSHFPSKELSFYEEFALRGIRVDRVQPGRVICSFRVPPRLTDRSGNLAAGAIANIVDEIGASVMHGEGHPMDVSVNMSISNMSTAKVDDELEVTSMLQGELGSIYSTSVEKEGNRGDCCSRTAHVVQEARRQNLIYFSHQRAMEHHLHQTIKTYRSA